eukprot:m51a1_g1158 putative transient receptor potential channel (1027) ;mRNA; f:319485-322996
MSRIAPAPSAPTPPLGRELSSDDPPPAVIWRGSTPAPEELDGDFQASDEGSAIDYGATFHCERGHILTEADSDKHTLCDQCFKLVADGKVHTCLKCSYVLCHACSVARLASEMSKGVERLERNLQEISDKRCFSCPAGHPLVFVSPAGAQEAICARCKDRRVPPGLRCETCSNFQLCTTCLLVEAEDSARGGSGEQPDEALVKRYWGIKCMRHRRRATVTILDGKELYFDFFCIMCKRGLLEEDPGDPIQEGETVVMCTVPRCELALCRRCSDALVRTRLVASRVHPTRMDFTRTDLSVEVGRYPFMCTLCGVYYRPDPETNEPLVWLSDEKTCFTMCIKCMAEDRIMKCTASVSGAPVADQFPNYSQWEAFATKQERLYEKDFRVTSILDTPSLNTGEVAFRELELKVHLLGKMPMPIVYEVEVALARKELLKDFDPLLRKLLMHSKWPLHTAMRLLNHAQKCRDAYDQTAAIWTTQVEHLQKITVEMIEHFDEPGYLKNVIMDPRPGDQEPPTSILELALEAGHTEWLAHRAVQSVVMQKWESPLRTDENTDAATFVITRVALWFCAVLITFANKITRGRVGQSLPTIQARQKHPVTTLYTVEQDKTQMSLLDFFSMSPKTAFFLSFLFYMAFLGQVSYQASRTTRPHFEVWDIVLSIHISGLVLVELIQLAKRGFDYFESMWNYFDIIHLTTYIAVLSIKLSSSLVHNSETKTNLMIGYDCLFAAAVFMTYTRGLYVLLPFQRIGPMLVSFGRMLKDVSTFIVLALVVIIAFSFSLSILYNNSGKPYIQTGSTEEVVPEDPSDMWRLNLFFKVYKTFLFGINNMPNFDPYELDGGRMILTIIFILAFMVVTTIVLVNLLIAIMNNTYSTIMEKADHEHKAHFCSVVEEFSKTSPLPPPLNLVTVVVIPISILIARVMRAAPSWFCGCCYCSCLGSQCFHDVSPWSNPARGLFCLSVHRHTTSFLTVKRLAKACVAEAAVYDKLHGWLQDRLLKARDDEEEELKELIDKHTAEIFELSKQVAMN